jgi:hypothetical protein
MRWAMNIAPVDMKKLFSLGSQEQKMSMVHDHIKTIINSSSTDGYLNYYPFDDDWILKAKFNWE